MTSFFSDKLAIVGLGLMGGSLALALRERARCIIGMDLDPKTRDYAVQQQIVDYATDDLYTAVHEADTVILATPVRVILDLVQNRIGAYLRSNTLLIDIGSTKADICEAMGRLPIGIHAIGGHPMTGKETNGIEVSDATLYHGKPFVLCDTRRTTPATRLRALGLVEAIQAMPVEMDAERHDRVVATISHVPYLLSAALMATALRQAEQDEAVWTLAAGGFRDMTRLAGSDITMISDIVSTNRQAIAELLAHFRVQLALLETMLISNDQDRLRETLKPMRQARINWTKYYERR
ncbi:MAG: prephenate dehydrogenase/arogenate dehydrogenase family protein [Phototrophicales bacterium]|nr:MAG: prephenate dehydrogenase/arogenate dehydrogenase family protein [Phototrophicales bacterium]RMG73837.1 MAG: prephenate dehydrogenase [Chloroflexota bacterium]